MGACKSCGKSFADGAKFCPSCGATVKSDVTNQENVSETRIVGQPEKKLFFKTPIIIGLCILLIGGGVLAAVLVMNKSPKQSYLLSEYKTYEKTMEETKEKYGENIDFQLKMFEQPFTSQYSLSGDLESTAAEGDPTNELIREMLNVGEISMEVNKDPKNRASQMKIGLNMEDQSVIEAAFYQSDEQMGVSIPAVLDTFFYLNVEDYGEFMRKIDPAYEGPEDFNVDQFTFPFGDLKLSEKEQEYLTETYGKLLYDNLEEDYFSEKKNVEFEHKGVKMELRELTFTMSPEEIEQLFTALVDQMIKDEKLQDMYAKRGKLLSDIFLSVEGNTFDEDEIRDEFVKSLKELKEDLEKNEEAEEAVGGFTSKILVDKDDYIIKRDIELTAEDGGVAVSSTDVMDGDEKRYQDTTLDMTADDEYVSIHIINDITYKQDGRTEDMKVEYKDDRDEKATFSMSSEFDGNNAKKQDIDRTFSLELLNVDTSTGSAGIDGTVTQSNDVSVEDNYSKNKYTFEVKVKDEHDLGKIVLNLENDKKIEEKLDMPDLKDGVSGTTNVMDLTEEIIMEAYPEVMINLADIGEVFGLSMYDVVTNFDPYRYYYNNYYYNNYYYGDSYYDDGYYDDGYYDEDSYEDNYDQSLDEIGEGSTDL